MLVLFGDVGWVLFEFDVVDVSVVGGVVLDVLWDGWFFVLLYFEVSGYV